ncbi:MAG: DUF3078 domain-containing protein [Dysgonamonadaceae bacterium]|jgi:hypothetical protein|nr:DUF3078 domain-containing protein [Dysgonamonadaceae bacterium]
MKKISLILFFFIMGLFTCITAQDKTAVDNLSNYAPKDTLQGWKRSGIAGITFGQTSLNNWVAGGNNTVSGNFILNASANYLKNKWFWDNNLSAEYGMVYSSSTDWQKATDKLNLTSIAGYKVSSRWAAAFLLNFYSQFSKGYNYPDKTHHISNLLAPAYLDAALGLSYKQSDYALFLSPLAQRAIFVLDDSLSNIGAFGVKEGKKLRFETGAYVLASTSQTISENLKLIASLNLFTPYNEDFGNIDTNLNLLLSYKLNKLLTATLNTTLRYYDDEIKKVQFKEILGLGLTYNF